MRFEGGVADRGTGVPSEAEADTVGPVVAAQSVSCVELLDRGVGCAAVFAAAKASSGLVSPSVGMAKTESKAVSAAGEIDPRPVQPSAVDMEAETQGTHLPGEVERPPILARGPCVRKLGKSVEVRGSPPVATLLARRTSPVKAVLSVRGTSPPKAVLSVRGMSPSKPTPGIGEDRVGSPQDRVR